MKTRLILAFSLLILSLTSGCTYAIRYDGTYSGKVVDADTREPIDGAVVLGTWYTIQRSVGGGVSYYYDARETVTDKTGEFSIPGQGLRIMSNLEPMSVLIFKAGYNYEQAGTWNTLKMGLYSKDRIKWEGDKPIFQLKKLSIEERKRRGGPPSPPTEASFERVEFMLREIDKDRKECGLDARGFWRGKKYD
jgi:hypothetical protein